MKSLTAQEIFQTRDTEQRVWVATPDWGGGVYVRQVTAGDRDDFETKTSELREKGKPLKARARFAILVCCDEEGRPLFEPQHLNVLNEKSGAMLDRIWDAGTKLNCWLRGAAEMEALEKNSAPTEDFDSA